MARSRHAAAPAASPDPRPVAASSSLDGRSPLFPLPYRLPEESPEALDAWAQAVLRPPRGFARVTRAQVAGWLANPETAELALRRLPWAGLSGDGIESAREADSPRLGPWPEEAQPFQPFRAEWTALVEAIGRAAGRGAPIWTPTTEILLDLTGVYGAYEPRIHDQLQALITTHMVPWVLSHLETEWDLMAPLLRRPQADILRRAIAVKDAPISDRALDLLCEVPDGLHVLLEDVRLTDVQRNRVVAATLDGIEHDPVGTAPYVVTCTDRVRVLWVLSGAGWSRQHGPITDPAILATMRRLAAADLPEFLEFVPHWLHQYATAEDLEALWDRFVGDRQVNPTATGRVSPADLARAVAGSRALTAEQAERLLAPGKRQLTILEGLAANRARLGDAPVRDAILAANRVPLVKPATLRAAPDPVAIPYFER